MTTTTASALPTSVAGQWACHIDDGVRNRAVTMTRHLVDETIKLFRADGWDYRLHSVETSDQGDVHVTLIRQTRKGVDYKNGLGISMSLADLAADRTSSPQHLAGIVARIEATIADGAAPAPITVPMPAAQPGECPDCLAPEGECNAATCPAYASDDAPATDIEDDEEPDREPTAEQERAWDAREDDARGHLLVDPADWADDAPIAEDTGMTDGRWNPPSPARAAMVVRHVDELLAFYAARGVTDLAEQMTQARVQIRRAYSAVTSPGIRELFSQQIRELARRTLAADAPLGRIEFEGGNADAPSCLCGNDATSDGFRPVMVTDTADGKVGTFTDDCGDDWFAAGRHVACLSDGCLRVWSDNDIDGGARTDLSEATSARVLFRLHHVAEPATA